MKKLHPTIWQLYANAGVPTDHQRKCVHDLHRAGRSVKRIAGCTGIPERVVLRALQEGKGGSTNVQ